MDHFILTRFNIPLGRAGGEKGCDPNWLEHRFKLFREWSLPSIRSQSCSRFRWLCFFAEKTPTEYLREIEACRPAEVVIVPDCQAPRYMWRTFLRTAVLAVTCRATQEWVAQTRLDNDDSIAWDFVEHIRQNLRETREWLSLPNGCVFSDDYYKLHWPVNPYITLTEPVSDIMTPYHLSLGTHSADDYSPSRCISDEISWCCNIHGRNLMNSPEMATGPKLPLRDMQRRFRRQLLSRVDLINLLIERRGYKRYLEIGVSSGYVFEQIKAESKIGVDPSGSAATVKATSDAFFTSDDYREESFDIVFVDGLHHWQNVLRDVDNSLSRINPNGIVILHDCMPTEYEHQLRSPSAKAWQGAWNGDVWKAFVILRSRPDLDCAVLNCDHGLGVVLPRPNTQIIECPTELTWRDYCNRRIELLRVVDVPGLLEFLEEPVAAVLMV